MRNLLPAIMVISVIGVYSTNQQVLDLIFLCCFGLLGYLMRNTGFPVAPVILGMVLGNRMEEALRQAMIISQGSLAIFVQRPIALTFLVLAAISICIPSLLRKFKVEKSPDGI
jgi:putative tricarboxylic transport membrane protein